MYCLCECFEKNMEIFNYMVSSSKASLVFHIFPIRVKSVKVPKLVNT